MFVKGYRFLPCYKNVGKIIGKNINKNLNSKYSQKRFDHAKRSAAVAIKHCSKKKSKRQ